MQFVMNVVPVGSNVFVNLTNFLRRKTTMLTYAMIVVQNYLAALKREEGQGMAEYGLILVFVALVAIAGFTLLGDQVDALMSGIAGELTIVP
jgi:pilus assembly protein Flp/PilA